MPNPYPASVTDRNDLIYYQEVESRLAALETAVSDIDLLSQIITDPPTQAEVQNISDKIDEVLTALKGV